MLPPMTERILERFTTKNSTCANVTFFVWYKYSPSRGWSDYSANVSLNGDRTQLNITLVDGGTGDDDNQQNGIIVDPSGMGAAPAGIASSNPSGGGSGGSGRFIDTLSNNFTFFPF